MLQWNPIVFVRSTVTWTDCPGSIVSSTLSSSSVNVCVTESSFVTVIVVEPDATDSVLGSNARSAIVIAAPPADVDRRT